MAFCLEDSIRDEALEEAEAFAEHYKLSANETFRKINCHLYLSASVHQSTWNMFTLLLSPFYDVVTGYILPKFDLSNCDEYKRIISSINAELSAPLYIMPILESKMIADIAGRTSTLLKIKENLDSMQEYILNVRVGGNDFSNLYGLRRGSKSEYISNRSNPDILIDIINVFAADYVVSGPVWEYFWDRFI